MTTAFDEPPNSFQGEIRISVKRRLMFGFGVLVALLTLSGAVSLWEIDRIDTALMRIVKVEEPLEEAVLEMEIQAGKTARALLHYVHEPKEEFLKNARRSECEFHNYSERFKSLAENSEERRLGRDVLQTYAEFKAIGEQLVEVSSQRLAHLRKLRKEARLINDLLAKVSDKMMSALPSAGIDKLFAVLQMEVEIQRTFAVVEAYTAMHDPSFKEELQDAIQSFQRQSERFRETAATQAELSAVGQLEEQFAQSVVAARGAMALTDQLYDRGRQFEADLEMMDAVLDDQVQPIIHADAVAAAEDAMSSSRRAVALLACLSVLGVLAGGFLGWNISDGIIRPVNELVRGTKIIGEGNRDHRIEVVSSDEFGALAAAFNGMVDNLNRSADELLESQREAERLKLLAAQREAQQLAAEARTDPLTKLPNRRAFDDLIAQHVEECSLRGELLAVALFDVDHFKSFNDNHGHQAGDEVLQGVAAVLAKVFAAPECAARIGGEEFAAVLPYCSLKEAVAKAEEALRAIETTAFEIDGLKLQVTASAGVAQLAPDRNLDAVIRQADTALYAAKDAGRNCVHAHDGHQIVSAETLKDSPSAASA